MMFFLSMQIRPVGMRGKESQMSRVRSEKTILDAAEAIVIDSGAVHMTLDAVAARSGISKGGVMYNFPTKKALIEAMVERMKVRFDHLRETLRGDLPQSRMKELMVEIHTLQGDADASHRLSAALLAAASNQPALTHSVRNTMRDRFFNEITSEDDFARSSVLFFAALGIHFHDLLNLSLLDHEQRKTIFGELIRLASEEQAI
jgi:AcrR family transcriptional regulator